MWCNGAFKIGFYAFRNIEVGEELLLDYHYQEKFEQYVSIPDPKTKKGK